MSPSHTFAWLIFTVILYQYTALSSSFSSQQPASAVVKCHSDERLALMQFKHNFIHDTGLCDPKVDRWGDSQGDIDCCSWDGIECDQITGQVIGLDLSCSCLYGSINSSSTLFRLLHLQRLNLAINDFNYSLIPSAFAHLSMLTYLNLSNSKFSGQIPSSISKLYRLSSLDLSRNCVTYPQFERLLVLKNPDLKSLLKNLTNLKNLNLAYVDVASSPIPSVLTNFSSLTSLNFESCGLQGMFPLSIFKLPKLETLVLVDNLGVTGYFPEFNFGNKLKVVALMRTSFFGELPASIGNLDSLEILGLGECNFSGSVPPTLGNLPNLKVLDLANNSFTGSLPSTLCNLTNLSILDLYSNHFTGLIPPELTNLTELTQLNLFDNMLQGPVPSSISKLKKLQIFACGSNSLSGVLLIDSFLELKDLQMLYLSLTDIHFVSGNNISKSTTTGPQLVDLELAFCHLTEFPSFLRNQHRLEILDLSSNNIQGQIPQWMSKVSLKTLSVLGLSNNSITGFDKSFPVVLPWPNLQYLDLDSNILRGSLPIPPLSTRYYFVSNNSLTGKIPHQLCNHTSLSILLFSDNHLSGEIPMCLSNFSKSLSVLKVSSNNFNGPVPNSWASGNRLKFIDLSKNRLTGKLPRSLKECKMLEYLDLGNNQIIDAFPSWLGTLPKLDVLILSSNALYGVIGDPNKYSNDLLVFPYLRIVDLSHNGFDGPLPSGYFERWIAMTSTEDEEKKKEANYMEENMYLKLYYVNLPRFNLMNVPRSNVTTVSGPYSYSMTITNKGTKIFYQKIIRTLVTIDLSSNKFDGEIRKSIGKLKDLRLLNLSNNNLEGEIPISISKLTNLETLDLSQNKLEGRIPLELSSKLTFLEVLDVSHNHLTGLIPQGHQFDTFERSSYDGNLGLCGKPLLNGCNSSTSGNIAPPSSTSSEDQSGSLVGFDWKVVLLGYGCGFPVGMVIGNVVIKRKYDWFAKTFSVRHGRRRLRR